MKNSQITRTIVREMRQLMSVYCNVITPGQVALGDSAVVTGRNAG